ncbi:hypothetical protein [Mucilaginibacter auburnensis]|uniref:LTXXQ motif family protein n=1 Tax=Mucilaginibacter auburnensis TaxID=1457233 RepID=A0A2H9VL66_9SPHI|nr:hypothetical protein [Mucilaginibacter auburnensis]PJJ79063.1 hypothetical protein CLV57_2187 [Mucilaginibacter auburnensis]
MKKLLLVSAFVLGVSAVSFAQGRMGGTPDQQVERLKTQIAGITDAQAAKIKVVYETQAKSRDSLMQAGGDMQANMATFMKMRETANAKIKAVLTPEQATAFQKQVDEQAAQMRQRMGN